jgi:hypothetical protein
VLKKIYFSFTLNNQKEQKVKKIKNKDRGREEHDGENMAVFQQVNKVCAMLNIGLFTFDSSTKFNQIC